ncbi:patatin-like phospholipase family protein [Anabaena sp. UHCC 0204]|uniref:patatin-like phospholipase family protein n=1 Tax=Anabaena sp. UHCC 0204 TaxID=2590009 RepID=UPI0014475B97|nr:patatin-like phospholipase family protein [Anabaena sp. UHCC 0204]MTJ09022.1 patatin-like phospholipase family protein [Anabaena sp. UHCC 0204]
MITTKKENLNITTEKERVGLVLSGGGSRGAYHIGVIQCLAEHNIKIDVISGASIGALNGAFIAAENNLTIAAKRLQEIWNLLAEDSPSKLKIDVTTFLVLKLLSEIMGKLGGELLKEVINSLNLPSEKLGLLEQEYINKLLTNNNINVEKLKAGLPLYVSVYRTQGALNDIKSVILAAMNLKNTPFSEFLHIQSLEQTKQRDIILASAALPLIFESKHGFADGGMGSFIDSQGNTPAYPLVHKESCSHIIVTHLDNGSLWDRYKYNASKAILLEIRPKESMNREGWKDLINFNANSIQSWIDQGYEDTERCLKKVSDAIILRRMAQKTKTMKEEALKRLDEDNFHID